MNRLTLPVDELILLIPNDVVGDGEPGEPLSSGVVQIILAMTTARYWPLDFGERLDDCVELLFKDAATIPEAENAARHFIAKGGAV